MHKWFVLVALACTACSENPAWYPLPPQKVERVQYETTAFFRMNDPGVDEIIVDDIEGTAEGGGWRWSHKRPHLKLPPLRKPAAKLVVDFAIAAQTFETTGPLTLDFLVNGKRVDRVRYDKPGNYKYEKPVEVNTAAPNILEIEVDKVWISPADGTRLGIILSAAGFVP